MSSDWNEPGATWQETPHANWTQSPDLNPSEHVEDDYPIHAQKGNYAYASDAGNMLDTSFSEEQDIFPDDPELDEGEESDTAGTDPLAKPDSFLKQLWYYVTLIVFPLVFFGIACLLILPSIVTDHGILSFWLIAIVFLLIAVGQGVAVYFSGQENHMWVPGTLGGLILFVLVGVFVVNPWVSIGILLLIVAGGIYLAQRSIHPVDEGIVDIVYVSGKYTRTLFPGFNLIWPWEKVMHHVNIGVTDWICPPQKIQLSPEEDVILRAVIRYKVAPEDAHIAVTEINNWEESLRNLFVTTLQTIVTHFAPTDFLAWPQSLQVYRDQNRHVPDEGRDDFSGGPARRERINRLLFEQMRDNLAPLGVQIHQVYIRDIELVPHTLAKISAAPMLPNHTETINDDQTEQDLVGGSSAAQTNRAQSANGRGKDNAGGPSEHIPADQEITQALEGPANSNAAQPSQPQKPLTEEAMRKTYEAVQKGTVRNPESIRRFAAMFEAVARDPEASHKISFDVERAAASLYKQAEHYEELHRSGHL